MRGLCFAAPSSVNRLTRGPHLPAVLLVPRRDGTMKRGPIESELAIESRTPTGAACRSRRRAVRSALVGNPSTIGCNLDTRFERAPGLVGLDNAICNPRRRFYRSCHHREPHVFDDDELSLRTVANRPDSGARAADPHGDLNPAGAKTQGAFGDSGKPPRA